jgi:MoaA/NifB/PqqE/SkfB family radical SAM enzyme
MDRGGDLIPPPITANIALTNKCNLRCEICGSQKSLDLEGSGRRHTELDLLKSIAETVFPFLVTVELNSQGDPLLSPHIETVLSLIREHKCELKVQTNGTLFSDRIVGLLASMHGEVNISVDAVGPKFDEVRAGGVWSKAEPGMLKLLRDRDPRQLKVGLYPTLTRRTIGEVVNILEWAERNGVDAVTFHRYDLLANGMSFEEVPTAQEYGNARAAATRWCNSNHQMNVWFEGERINSEAIPTRKDKVASPEKQEFLRFYNAPSYPVEGRAAICAAPDSYIEIGLEGEISACCRSQEIPIGNATSVEGFADTWFGHNYAVIRESLMPTAKGEFPLPNCAQCIEYYAPNSLCGRKPMTYGDGSSTQRPDGLELAVKGDIVLRHIRQERDSLYRAGYIPPGVNFSRFDLLEEDTVFRRVDRQEDVDAGSYFANGRRIFFIATDGKDPRFTSSGRRYVLRPRGH